ncbi:MAG TPA: alpha/beta hydrolase [Xanthobacteraceae bacterium]|nr:alpha/beta hydrolase [Xanthobacteraceae bacterium]
MSDYVSHFVRTPDGLNLHARVYGRPNTRSLPVVCLHGLARTSADFHRLALALSGHPADRRQVIAVDFRGRGRSGYDPNPANYNVGTELNDVLTVLSALDIRAAVFIGTSRGGILTMLLATVRPEAIVGAVLNDIGPVIEPVGLMRIKGYVGKLSQPASFEDGGEMLRQRLGTQFTSLTADDWTAFARRTFEERDGKLVPSYDLALAQTLADFDIGQPLTPLWPQFEALARVPVMVIRGENSDLLSRETVAAMRQRKADLQVVEVPGQGHAPLLMEDDIIARLGRFVADCGRRPD